MLFSRNFSEESPAFRDEYHRYKDDGHRPLPHILGLTASPVFNPKNPEEDFKKLEDKLDAILIGVRDEKVEADGYVWKPIEKPLYYYDTGHYLPETDFEFMLDELEIWDLVNEEKIRNRIDNVKRVMGPLACDFYIMSWLWSIRDPVATKKSLQQIRASGRIREVEALHDKMYKALMKKKHYGMGDVSEKVKCLVQFLAGYRDKQGFHAIIFVEQRHHAQALALVLSKSQTLQQFVRAAHFVGHGSTGEERLTSEGMDAKKVDLPLMVSMSLPNDLYSKGKSSKISEMGTSTFWLQPMSPKKVWISRPVTSFYASIPCRPTKAIYRVEVGRVRRIPSS